MLRPQIASSFSTFDLNPFDENETYARALAYAETVYGIRGKGVFSTHP